MTITTYKHHIIKKNGYIYTSISLYNLNILALHVNTGCNKKKILIKKTIFRAFFVDNDKKEYQVNHCKPTILFH